MTEFNRQIVDFDISMDMDPFNNDIKTRSGLRVLMQSAILLLNNDQYSVPYEQAAGGRIREMFFNKAPSRFLLPSIRKRLVTVLEKYDPVAEVENLTIDIQERFVIVSVSISQKRDKAIYTQDFKFFR